MFPAGRHLPDTLIVKDYLSGCGPTLFSITGSRRVLRKRQDRLTYSRFLISSPILNSTGIRRDVESVRRRICTIFR